MFHDKIRMHLQNDICFLFLLCSSHVHMHFKRKLNEQKNCTPTFVVYILFYFLFFSKSKTKSEILYLMEDYNSIFLLKLLITANWKMFFFFSLSVCFLICTCTWCLCLSEYERINAHSIHSEWILFKKLNRIYQEI